jgi:MoaA/NifB/PqqE/SkfB family radical SAM enzyme
VLDRVIGEAKSLWGTPLVVFSGGEPLAYHSEGRDLLELVEKHPDLLYLMFTNGTLVDQKVAARLERVGCVTPAISLEGMREETDRRRGAGTFNRVRKAMALLRKAGVPFGVSLTATRTNCDELLSDRFLDLCFLEQGAFYGFLFMYMPTGRTAQVDLMPTPHQRLLLWRRTWDVVVRRQLFLFDFWNHASLVHGCLAAGRPGGYLHIDWDGRVMPCVFAPYAGANILHTYDGGGTLNDVWRAPFFEAIRRWQREHDARSPSRSPVDNWLMPCPVRDHYLDFRSCVAEHRPEPEDEAARAVLEDEGYRSAMAAYGRDLRLATSELCEWVYRGPNAGKARKSLVL